MLYGVSPDFIWPDYNSNMAEICFVYFTLSSYESKDFPFSKEERYKMVLVAVAGVPNIKMSKVYYDPYFFEPHILTLHFPLSH
jgi:hypothetical protein